MPKVSYNKPALSISEQIKRLQKRGLVIDDYKEAELQLKTIGYYRLSGYWFPFRIRSEKGIEDKFRPNTKFSEVISLYEFDRQLRSLVLEAIENIEITIRTRLAYHLGHAYGAFGHIEPNNFHPRFNHNEWIEKRNVETERSKDRFVQHFKSKYKGFPDIPIWMLTEVISLGGLSVAYKGLKNHDKKRISDHIKIHHKKLTNWLHILTYVRNICAHHSRLWNKQLAIKAEVNRETNWNPPLTPKNDRIFYVLLILRQLLKHTPVNTNLWCSKVEGLVLDIEKNSQYLCSMGMTKEWKDHPLWK